MNTSRLRGSPLTLLVFLQSYYSTLSRSTLVDSSPSERFVALSLDSTLTLCYPEKWSHDDIIRDLDEFLLRSAGPIGPCYEKEFAGLKDRITIKHGPETSNDASSSAERIHQLPIRRLSLAVLPEACPSLDSDHGSSSNETENGDATTAPDASSETHAVSEGSSRAYERPSIYTTLRRVFPSEPSFAERIIVSVNRLPTEKRKLLVGYDTECADGSSSNPSKSDEPPPKKCRTTSNKSKKGDDGNRSNNNGGGRGGHGDGEEEGEEEGDGTSSSATLRREKKNPGWNCPWNLAYPEMHEIPCFKHCSSRTMFDKSVWRSHLDTHHSPRAKLKSRNSEQHAKFYMSHEKSEKIEQIFKTYSKRHRDPEKRTDHLKDLFDEVWCTIFPNDEFANLEKPLSPFHLDSREIPNLEQHLASQAQILVETFYKARADEEIGAGTIQSRSEYLPTTEQTKVIMSQALAVILACSPAITGGTQWLARAPLDAIEVAGRHYRDNSMSQSTSNRLDEQAVPNNGTPLIPPTPTAVPEVPQLARGGIGAMDTLPVPLLPSGTLLELKPLDANLPQGSTGKAYISLPSTHYVASTRPAPLPSWSTVPNQMMDPIVADPNYAPQPTTGFTPDTYGQFPAPIIRDQDVSRQPFQAGPVGQSEWDLQNGAMASQKW
ncbi:hypothetical protein FGRMN_2837 [Fusarium graminum]|nr:hypothetical protein FGRMN_2837 [Fusarium graminum]